MFKFKVYTFGQAVAVLVATIAIIAALWIFLHWLWGIIAVAIFGLPQLSFWQFVGLTILIRWFISGTSLDKLVDFKAMDGENNGNSNNS